MARKRCIVTGCSAATEEENFRRRLSMDGHAVCPVHQKDSTACTCSRKTKLFFLYEFPTIPALRSLWIDLLEITVERNLEKRDCVCGKHFVSLGQQKIPVKDIGRSQEDIDRILEKNARKIIQETAERHRLTELGVALSMESADELATAATVVKEIVSSNISLGKYFINFKKL